MDKQMWFGIRGRMRWVPCPAVGATYGRAGYGSVLNLTNGGAVARLSMSAARTYSLSWSLNPIDELSHISSYAEGVYGPGFIYWSDPFNMGRNVLSQTWATPALGSYDGPILTGEASRPTRVPTDANIYDLPPESAVYTVKPSSPVLKHWVPIPPGHTAWVGIYGSGADDGGRVIVQPTGAGQPSGSPIQVVPMSVSEPVRHVDMVKSSDGFDGLELSLGGDGDVTISGMSVRVLPDAMTAGSNEFIPGRGHAGCTFTTHPSVSAYSAALGLQEMSAEFLEVAPWQLS